MELSFTVGAEYEGKELRKFVRNHARLSSSLWKRVKWDGKVLINGEEIHNARTILREGDRLLLSWSEENEVVPSRIPLDILYEDEDLLIVNKGTGMIIHPTSREGTDTLVNAVAGYFLDRGISAGIHPVYRLDRNTTGLVVVAKSAHVQYELSRSHSVIYREYLALAEGKVEPPEGTIDLPIGRKEGSIVEWTVRPDGKGALTDYQVLAANTEMSLLRIHLRTGRTHQIRVHFSHSGHPLLGDDLYGGKTDRMNRQALHAWTVSFVHPMTKRKMTFTAPLPADMREAAETIRPGLLEEEGIE